MQVGFQLGAVAGGRRGGQRDARADCVVELAAVFVVGAARPVAIGFVELPAGAALAVRGAAAVGGRVLGVSASSASACATPRCASAVGSTSPFSRRIAPPRLDPLPVGLPSRFMPVIADLRSPNGMRRFSDTCTAATNCPRLLKPAVALFRSQFGGSTAFTLLWIFTLPASCSATALVGVHASAGEPVGVVDAGAF